MTRPLKPDPVADTPLLLFLRLSPGQNDVGRAAHVTVSGLSPGQNDVGRAAHVTVSGLSPRQNDVGRAAHVTVSGLSLRQMTWAARRTSVSRG